MTVRARLGARKVWRKILAAVAALGLALSPRVARADPPATPPPEPAPENVATSLPAPYATPFIQYGVAFTTEFVASSGQFCKNGSVPCILGSGGGVVFPRIGWRSIGHWYIGGAYEISKQDASTLYQLPIMQQLRAEARYYVLDGHVAAPFVEASAGGAAYGNEWKVDTYGPCVSLAVGVETQITRRTAVGATFAYRVIHFSGFTDTSGAVRDQSFAQLVGLNILFELRDPY
jgi:hypothetical protein